MSTALDARPAGLGADPEHPHDPTFVQSVGLVAGREISTRLRSKAFLISTGILMLAVLASVVLSGVFGGIQQTKRIAVVGDTAAAAAEVDFFELVPVDDPAAGEALLRDGEVEAVLVPSDSPTGMTVIGLDQAPVDVVQALAVSPDVVVLDPAAAPPILIYFVAFGFGIVFFMSALTFGSTIAQSVVEEKQTRIVEILLSTVSPRALLTGKVLGNSLLAFGQIAAIAVIALTGLVVTGQRVLLGGLGPSVIWFVVFFVIGFVMLAALYAGTAALVSRLEDVGTTTAPVMYLIMIPYILVIVFNNDPTVLGVMSYVPFSAPVGMPMRVFLGTAEWWEPLLSLVILLATTAVALGIGERLYRNSLLRTGARVKLTEALRG